MLYLLFLYDIILIYVDIQGEKKKMKKILTGILVFAMVILTVLTPMETKATTIPKNVMAQKAYAKAITKGKIPYNEEKYGTHTPAYALYDVDKDGMKELFVYDTDTNLYIWAYKNSKLKCLAKYYCCDQVVSMYYNSKTKRYWIYTEGDGVYYTSYRCNNGKLIEKANYSSCAYTTKKIQYNKYVNGKTSVISKKEYKKAIDKKNLGSEIKFNELSKKKIISKFASTVSSKASISSKRKQALRAYENFLKNPNKLWSSNAYQITKTTDSHIKFRIVDLNQDKVPELLVHDDYASNGSGQLGVYAYVQGKRKLVARYALWDVTFYCNKSGGVYSVITRDGSTGTYEVFDGKKMKTVQCWSARYNYDLNKMESKTYYNAKNKKITKGAFQRKQKKLIKNGKRIKISEGAKNMHKNTVANRKKYIGKRWHSDPYCVR